MADQVEPTTGAISSYLGGQNADLMAILKTLAAQKAAQPSAPPVTTGDISSYLGGQNADLNAQLATLAQQKAGAPQSPPLDQPPVDNFSQPEGPPQALGNAVAHGVQLPGGGTPRERLEAFLTSHLPQVPDAPVDQSQNPSNESGGGLGMSAAQPQGLPQQQASGVDANGGYVPGNAGPAAQPKTPVAPIQAIVAQHALSNPDTDLGSEQGLPSKNPFRGGSSEEAPPTVGKALSKSGAGGGGGKGRSAVAGALSSSSRDNENGALNAGLLSFAVNLLFKPQWSLGDSISSAVQDAADSYSNFMGQRSQEVKDQQEGDLNKAKIGEINASTAEKYAQAGKAKSGSAVDSATIKTMLENKPGKNDNPYGFLPQALKLQDTLDKKIDPLMSPTAKDRATEAMTNTEAAGLLDQKLRAAYHIGSDNDVLKAKDQMGKGTLDMTTLQSAFPQALAMAKVNPKAANNLRAWMSKNPTELAKLEAQLK